MRAFLILTVLALVQGTSAAVASPYAGFTTARADEEGLAPGQVAVQLAEEVFDLPANPRRRFFDLSEVPIEPLSFRTLLEQEEIDRVELIAIPWRWVESTPLPDSAAFVPRNWRAFVTSMCSTSLAHAPSLLSSERCANTLRLFGAGVNPLLQPTSYWPTDLYLSCPTNCGRNYQWNFENTGETINTIDCVDSIQIGLRGAYDIQESCTRRIGVLDSGVDIEHDDLLDNINFTYGRNFGDGPGDTLLINDVNGHGTGSAGIMAALHSGGASVVGICGKDPGEEPTGLLVPLKIYSSTDATIDTATATAVVTSVPLHHSLGGPDKRHGSGNALPSPREQLLPA